MDHRRERLPHGEAGQTTAEKLGLVVLVAALVAAIVASPVPGQLASLVRQVLCRLAGADCAADSAAGIPQEPCVVSSAQEQFELGVGAGIMALGGGTTLLIEELSDGTVRLTRISGASVGVGAGVGVDLELDLGDIVLGGSSSAGIAAALDGHITAIEIYADAEDAADAIAHATMETRIRTGAGLLAPIATAVQDAIDRDDPTPSSEETQVTIGVVADAVAGAMSGNAISRAQIEAGLEHAQQITVSSDGTITVSRAVSAEAAASLGLGPLTIAGNLEGRATTTVTLADDGTPLEVSLTLSGSAAGGVVPGLGELGGSMPDAAEGQQRVVEAVIDLTVRPDLADEAVGLLTPEPIVSVASIPDLWEAIGADGSTVAVAVYDIESVDHGIAIGGALGVEARVSAARSTTSVSLIDATYLDPSTGSFVPWEACDGS